jgi:hypothetical protein
MNPLPDPGIWGLVDNSDTDWVKGSTDFLIAVSDESRTYLKPATENERLEVVLAPYLLVACLFIRDFINGICYPGKNTRLFYSHYLVVAWRVPFRRVKDGFQFTPPSPYFFTFTPSGSGIRHRSRIGILFDRYVGTYGEYFEHRVMFQQLFTVGIQSWTKLPAIGAAAWAAEATRSPAIRTEGASETAELLFWVVLGALVFNALYPAMFPHVGNAGVARPASMIIDASLDIVYSVAAVEILHATVGPASAPAEVVAYLSTFIPAFHVFSVACGLELVAMQRAHVMQGGDQRPSSLRHRINPGAVAPAQAQITAVQPEEHQPNHRSTLKGRIASVEETAQRKGHIKTLIKRWHSAVFALFMFGVIGSSLVVRCRSGFPLADPDPCQPCVCLDGILISCEAATEVYPNELFMANKGIRGIGAEAFEIGFDSITYVDFRRNSIVEVRAYGGGGSGVGCSPTCTLDLLNIVFNASSCHAKCLIFPSTNLQVQSLPSKVEVLLLERNAIDVGGALVLAGVLQQNVNLVELSLGYNSVNDEGAAVVFKALENAHQITHVRLEINGIGSEGAIAIANSLQGHHSLSLFSISGNALGNEGAISIASMLKGKSDMAYLAFIGCSVGKVSMPMISDAPCVRPTIVYSMQHVREGGVTLVLTLHFFLRSRQFCEPHAFMQEGAIAVADALQEMSQLSVFEFGQNVIDANGGIAMAGALINNEHLSVLDLAGSKIGNEGAMALSTALKRKPQLYSLDLNTNAIGDEAMQILAETLTVAPALQTVNLLFNPINNETVAMVRDLLKQVPNLLVEAVETKGCPHLCPSGQLHDPNAKYPAGGDVSCLEQEEFCSASDENCDPCDLLQINAMSNSDCCGPREACPFGCEAGLAIARDNTFQFPGFGEVTCGLAVDFADTGVVRMPCDEINIYVHEFTLCCV